ncbi:hypothetical protein CANARDRAFT_10142 [[Candida] arabinofermentans NRRL YB-2248]|uniref:Calcipressin n=1 Tax=[Candida] arabinofermentans NRRL YB-2248 TaxID=983967 RepID=A0A1E4STP5_9ASCO|nr:hypothetical protein CANARDRAFT_10142 [[Candida] arabinofermentans NRRL YB-2248]
MCTNSIIITDINLLKVEHNDILNDLLITLQSLVSDKIIISNLRSFNRLILIFKDLKSSELIYDLLIKENIKCHYSMKDNVYDDSGDDVLLEPPERRVELQSPPASPYFGYVQKVEDPPDEVTISDPKSFSHLLYQPTLDNLNTEKVFEFDFKNKHEKLSVDTDDDDDDEIPILVIDREEAEVLRNVK